MVVLARPLDPNPAWVDRRAKGLRFAVGSLASWLLVMTDVISALLVCKTTVSAETSTTEDTLATSSLISAMGVSRPAPTLIWRMSTLLKPGATTERSYSPGRSPARVKVPALVVLVSNWAFADPGKLRATLAAGTGAPAGSLTVPETRPKFWAFRQSTAKAATSKVLQFIISPSKQICFRLYQISGTTASCESLACPRRRRRRRLCAGVACLRAATWRDGSGGRSASTRLARVGSGRDC